LTNTICLFDELFRLLGEQEREEKPPGWSYILRIPYMHGLEEVPEMLYIMGVLQKYSSLVQSKIQSMKQYTY
jgi:hypothetical protein